MMRVRSLFLRSLLYEIRVFKVSVLYLLEFLDLCILNLSFIFMFLFHSFFCVSFGARVFFIK